MKHTWLLSCIGISLLLLPFCVVAAQEIAVRSTDKYCNERENFCVRLPKEWTLSTGFDGHGAAIFPPGVETTADYPAIWLHGIADQSADSGEPESLEQNFEEMLSATKEMAAPGTFSLLAKNKVQFKNLPALTYELRYKDKKGKWVYETGLTFLARVEDEVDVFHLSLTAPVVASRRFRPALDSVIHSFEWIRGEV